MAVPNHARDPFDYIEDLLRRIRILEGDRAVLAGGTPPAGAAGGDLSGTYPNPTVAKVHGVAVTGTPTTGQAIVATGPTAATWQTVSGGGGAPSGPAGGDLSGTYPNPGVGKINGVAISGTPSTGQALRATSSSTATWEGDAVPPATFSYSGPVNVFTGTYPIFNDSGRTLTISQVRAAVGTAPAGASLIVTVRKNGADIFTTTAHRPTITAGSLTGVNSGAPDVPTIAPGEYWTVDVVQVGSTTPGASLQVTVVAS